MKSARAPGVLAIMLAFGASGVRADSVWDQAVVDTDAESAEFAYERSLEAGNEDVQLAVTESDLSAKKHHVEHAMTAYRAAIKAKPDGAEAHYRLGIAEFTFYLACDTAHPTLTCDASAPDPAVQQDVVDHWHKFTDLAPLDIRGDGLLFPRAILHTKLATRDNLLLAIADYEALADRREGTEVIGGSAENILSNLAETYMMVDRLDDAIATYDRAVALGADTSTIYGLAVALDRDGQGTRARELIKKLGNDAYESFQLRVAAGDTFFVPDGEVYYYLALVDESLGLNQQSIIHWDLYIRSGAHPQFQPRAKHNRDALSAKLGRKEK